MPTVRPAPDAAFPLPQRADASAAEPRTDDGPDFPTTLDAMHARAESRRAGSSARGEGDRTRGDDAHPDAPRTGSDGGRQSVASALANHVKGHRSPSAAKATPETTPTDPKSDGDAAAPAATPDPATGVVLAVDVTMTTTANAAASSTSDAESSAVPAGGADVATTTTAAFVAVSGTPPTSLHAADALASVAVTTATPEREASSATRTVSDTGDPAETEGDAAETAAVHATIGQDDVDLDAAAANEVGVGKRSASGSRPTPADASALHGDEGRAPADGTSTSRTVQTAPAVLSTPPRVAAPRHSGNADASAKDSTAAGDGASGTNPAAGTDVATTRVTRDDVGTAARGRSDAPTATSPQPTERPTLAAVSDASRTTSHPEPHRPTHHAHRDDSATSEDRATPAGKLVAATGAGRHGGTTESGAGQSDAQGDRATTTGVRVATAASTTHAVTAATTDHDGTAATPAAAAATDASASDVTPRAQLQAPATTSATTPHAERAAPARGDVTAIAPWTERVLESVRVATVRGGGEMRLRLEPAGLGHIDVRISLAHDGVRAAIVAEHGATRTLLQREQHLLEAALERSEMRLAGFSVDVGFGGSSAFPGAPHDGTPMRAGAFPASAEVEPTAATPIVLDDASGAGRLSVRV